MIGLDYVWQLFAEFEINLQSLSADMSVSIHKDTFIVERAKKDSTQINETDLCILRQAL